LILKYRNMYVITGATGNIGKIITRELLAKGKKVRIIGRNAEKMLELKENGAEVLVGDFFDESFVNNSFAGATAVYCMIPPNPHAKDFRKDQQIVAKNFVNAVVSNKVKHVILLSSIGAHLRTGAGVIDGLGDLEEYFSALKEVNVLILRPGYFMENIFGQIGIIKQLGIVGTPIRGDLKFPCVATKDIAALGAKRLLKLDFRGHTIEYILGPKDLSYNEITGIISKAIDKPDLNYVQFSYEDAKNGMVQSGFVSENMANLYMKMSEAFNSGIVLNVHTRTSENSTPTTFEEFVGGFAKAFKNS
jgi:uncharacterized protein YbjT (DUF2867 family)